MYKDCKTEQSVQRQRRFQTALFSMLQKQDYQSITITGLCQEAGIPRNAFYRYFDTLEDVLYGEMDAMIQESAVMLYEKPDIRGYFRYWEIHKDFLDVLERQHLSSNFEVRTYLRMAEQSADVALTFPLMRNICFMSGLMSLMIAWHHNGMQYTPEQMEEIFWKVFRRT